MSNWLSKLTADHNGVGHEIALLVLRVFTGVAMAVNHGLGKIRDVSGFVDKAIEPAGLPLPTLTGWLVAGGEFVGALLLAVGLLTRLMALWLLGIMLGAAFLVHGGDGFKVMEAALLFGVVFLVFAVRGGGRYSLDAAI